MAVLSVKVFPSRLAFTLTLSMLITPPWAADVFTNDELYTVNVQTSLLKDITPPFPFTRLPLKLVLQICNVKLFEVTFRKRACWLLKMLELITISTSLLRMITSFSSTLFISEDGLLSINVTFSSWMCCFPSFTSKKISPFKEN